MTRPLWPWAKSAWRKAISPRPVGAGSGFCPRRRRRARSAPGPAIPTRRSIRRPSARGWCWFPFSKDRLSGPARSFRASLALHGDARGASAGSEVRYAAALADLLNQSRVWPKVPPGADWPTFAGSPTRNAVCARGHRRGAPCNGERSSRIPLRLPRRDRRRSAWPTIRPHRWPTIPSSAAAASLWPMKMRSSVFAPTRAAGSGAIADLRSIAKRSDIPWP